MGKPDIIFIYGAARKVKLCLSLDGAVSNSASIDGQCLDFTRQSFGIAVTSIGTGVVLGFRCRPRRSAVPSITKKPCTAVFFAPSALVFDRS